MDEHDFVLCILNRDVNKTSLQEFVKQLLLEAVKLDHTMDFHRECQVLYLLDGLDKLNTARLTHGSM